MECAECSAGNLGRKGVKDSVGILEGFFEKGFGWDEGGGSREFCKFCC